MDSRSRSAAGSFFALAFPGFAQQATIQGEVRDPSGAAVPSATVSATNVREQTVVTARTNEAGFFSISGLVPGLYRVDVEASGFTTIQQNGLNLDVDLLPMMWSRWLV